MHDPAAVGVKGNECRNSLGLETHTKTCSDGERVRTKELENPGAGTHLLTQPRTRLHSVMPTAPLDEV